MESLWLQKQLILLRTPSPHSQNTTTTVGEYWLADGHLTRIRRDGRPPEDLCKDKKYIVIQHFSESLAQFGKIYRKLSQKVIGFTSVFYYVGFDTVMNETSKVLLDLWFYYSKVKHSLARDSLLFPTKFIRKWSPNRLIRNNHL